MGAGPSNGAGASTITGADGDAVTRESKFETAAVSREASDGEPIETEFSLDGSLDISQLIPLGKGEGTPDVLGKMYPTMTIPRNRRKEGRSYPRYWYRKVKWFAKFEDNKWHSVYLGKEKPQETEAENEQAIDIGGLVRLRS